MEAQFLYNPDKYGYHCHVPTLMESVSGDFLAAWYAYPEKETAGARLVLVRKPKGAEEWKRSQPVLEPFKSSAGNPVLFQNPSNGVIWLMFVLINRQYWDDAEIYISCSEDDGHTWSSSEKIDNSRGIMIRHQPVFCADSNPLLPVHDEAGRHSLLLKRNFGRWEQVYKFDDPELIQASLIRESENRLSLFFRPVDDPRRIWRSHSANEGKTWTQPMRTPLPCPLSGISAFKYGEYLVMVYNHTEDHCRYPLSISISPNGGTTWGKPWHIDQVDREVSYPVFIAGTDGLIHGVYTYMRRMVKYVSFEFDEILQNQ